MFARAFQQTQDKHGVSSARLTELTGIAASTISNFRNGKRDTTTETLWRLLQAIEQESPGAIADFAKLLSSGDERLGELFRAIAFRTIADYIERQPSGALP